MHPLGVVAIVIMLMAMDGVIVWAVLRAAAQGTRKLAAGHAPVEPAPDAVRREFQSFKIGMISLGCSIHVAVDAAYLHLYPSMLARWIGMPPMSIPWEDITLKKESRLSGVRVRIGGVDISGPRWCLQLASPATDAG